MGFTRFLEKALEEAFGQIEDPNQVMSEAADQLRSESRSEESISTALEASADNWSDEKVTESPRAAQVIDRCCDDPDCARNAEKLLVRKTSQFSWENMIH